MSLMKISDLFHFEKGSLQSSKCTPGEYDFITASAVWKTHNEYSHDCEALIFAAAASGSLGRTHYVNGKFISSDLCFILTPKDPKNLPIDLKFYHLIFQAFRDEIVRNTKSGTSKEAIGLRAFGKYQLPYFDIEKQIEVKKKFINAQSLTIELSTELTHQLDLVKKLRQAFLREAMQGKLTSEWRASHPELVEGSHSATELLAKIKAEKEKLIKEKKIKKQKPFPPITKEEIPFEIPENWVWCRLGEVGVCQTGTTPSTKIKKYFGNDIPFIKPADISLKGIRLDNEGLSFEGLKKGVLVPKNSLLMVCIGGSIGKSYFNEVDVSCNQQINTITPLKYIKSKFLQNWLQSDYFQKSIWEKASGGITPIVNRSKWESIPIPIPPLPEQKAIAAKLDKLMAYCDSLEESIKSSQTQNEMLLQQVLREALEPKEVTEKEEVQL